MSSPGIHGPLVAAALALQDKPEIRLQSLGKRDAIARGALVAELAVSPAHDTINPTGSARTTTPDGTG